MKKIFLFILYYGLATDILCATEYYVSPNGSNNNSGTIEAPSPAKTDVTPVWAVASRIPKIEFRIRESTNR